MSKKLYHDNQHRYHVNLNGSKKAEETIKLFYELWLPYIDAEDELHPIGEDGRKVTYPTIPRATMIPSRSPIDLPIALEPWVSNQHVFHIGVNHGDLMASWLLAGAKSVSGIEISAENIYGWAAIKKFYELNEGVSTEHQRFDFLNRSKFAIGNLWSLWNGAQTRVDAWEDPSIPKIFPTHEVQFITDVVRNNMREYWWPWVKLTNTGSASTIVNEWRNSDIVFCWSLRSECSSDDQIRELQNSLNISDADMPLYQKYLEENPSALDGLFLAKKIQDQTSKPKILIRMHSVHEEHARLEGDDVVSIDSVECGSYPKTSFFTWPDKTSKKWIEGHPLWISLKYINFTESIWKEKYPDIPVPKCLEGVE